MKKIMSLILTFSLLVSVFLSNGYIVHANDLIGPCRLELGVNMYYYITPGCEYTVSIPQAAYAWMYPGWDNPVYLAQTGDQQASLMDFYQVNTAEISYGNTATYMKNSDGVYVPCMGQGNYRYGNIYLNDRYLNNDPDRRVITCLHEMGHVFGLRDSYDRNSIMYESRTTYATGVTWDANDAVCQMY